MPDDTVTINTAGHDRFQSGLEATQKSSEAFGQMQEINTQITTEESMKEALQTDESGVNMLKHQEKELRAKKKPKVEETKGIQESVLVRKGDADALAEGFCKRQGNIEYHLAARLFSELAQSLGGKINENSQPDEIISFIRRQLTVDGQSPDAAIVDKAFEFLIEVAAGQMSKSTGETKERFGNILIKIESAKVKHFEAHAVDIQVAQKIIGAVDAVVKETGQTVKQTLDHFRDLIHNPPTLQEVRKSYEAKKGGYNEMMNEFKPLNTYLGSNFKRPDLEGPEIARLASTTRMMQAIIDVFRLTKGSLIVIEKYLNKMGAFESNLKLRT